MSDEVKAAAEKPESRLRRFAADLLEIHGEGPYQTGAAQRAVELACAYLAEHPADDDELIDAEWLRSVGFVEVGDKFKRLRIEIDGPTWRSAELIHFRLTDPYWRLDGCTENPFSSCEMRVATRGDVRRLAKALGIDLKA